MRLPAAAYACPRRRMPARGGAFACRGVLVAYLLALGGANGTLCGGDEGGNKWYICRGGRCWSVLGDRAVATPQSAGSSTCAVTRIAAPEGPLRFSLLLSCLPAHSLFFHHGAHGHRRSLIGLVVLS